MTSLMFAGEANNIRVLASDDVGIEIRVTTSDGIVRYDQTSTYTPVDGEIAFGDLADLINKCILLQEDMSDISLTSTPAPWARLLVSVTDSSTTTTQSAKVFYCQAWNMAGPTTMTNFVTQLRKRKVTRDIAHFPVWLPLMNEGTTTVNVAVTYVSGGSEGRASQTYTYAATSGSEGYQYIDAAMPVLVRSIMGALLYASATIYKYEVNIWASGVMVDTIEFEVVRQYYPQQSTWYFRNAFGLVETMLLLGREEETHSLDVDLGRSLFDYLALDKDVVREYATNSGWVSKAECRLLAELYRSPQTCRVHEKLGLRKVVVKDIDVVHRSPSNEPRSVDIIWRWADDRQEWLSDHDDAMLGHNVFDSTYTEVFD